MDQTTISAEAVLFDVGGTLIEPCPSVGHVYASVAADFGWQIHDIERINLQFSQAWKEKGDFQYNEEGWQSMVEKSFEGMIPREGCSTLFQELFLRFEDPEVWRIHGDVLPTLDALANRGFRLGVISNWDIRLRPLLKKLRLDTFFECISVSCDVGFTKPSPVIFEHTIVKLGLPAERVVHVGNHPLEDIQGAKNVGMHALLVDRSGTKDRTSLSRLTDLDPLLREAWI